MKKILLFALLVVLGNSCKKSVDKTTEKSQLQKTDWLVGTWENNSDEGKLEEIWSRQNDSVFKGNAYFIKGKDTLHNESILLAQLGNALTYSATVQGQNNDKAIAFKLTSATANQLVFENTAHDYPQKIVYSRITADSIVAEVSGKQQGKLSSEKYPMNRKK